MNIARIIIMSAILASATPAQTTNYDYIDGSEPEDMSIQFVDSNYDVINGRLIHSDDTYFFFHNHGEASYQVIPRSDVQYLETNLDINLQALLAEKDSDALGDVIEMNDGTRIACIILDVGIDNIQYFIGNSLKRQMIAANSIYMVYIDDANVSIPFPVAPTYHSVL